MLYIASAQPATCQLDAFRCDFVTPNVDCLVVNKLTRLEVYTIDVENEHLHLKLEIPLHGTIAAVTPIKLASDNASLLIVLTTSMQLFAIEYNASTRTHVDTVSTTSIYEQFGRVAEYQTIAVDPALRCLLVHAYNGLVRVVPLVEGSNKSTNGRRGSKSAASAAPVTTSVHLKVDLARGYNVRLSVLNVTALVMLPRSVESTSGDREPEESGPSLAIISTNHSGCPALSSHYLSLHEKEIGDKSDGPLTACTLDDPGSEKMIPIQGASNETSGVVVIGEESLLWVPTRSLSTSESPSKKGKGKAMPTDQKVTARLPVGQIQAWARLDADQAAPTQHYVLGDIYGKLLALAVQRDSNGDVCNLVVQELGDTASPTALVQLSERLLYLASRFGDSQLIRLPQSSFIFKKASSSLQRETAMDVDDEQDIALIQSYSSLAPILDCTVVQGDRGRPSQIVTCSGAYKGGSLRVVRQGVGFVEVADVEIENVQRLWTLRGGAEDVSYLVLSFFQETRLLKLRGAGEGPDDEVEEVEVGYFANEQPTLHACTLGQLMVQVTPVSVNFGTVSDDAARAWKPEEANKITLATSTDDALLVATEGGQLVLLQRDGDGLRQASTKEFEAEIACLDICVLAGRLVATITLWTLNTITLLDLTSLTMLSSQSVATTFPIRSVLLRTFEDDASILFCGLGDGSLLSFGVNATEAKILSETQRTAVVGSQPVSMTTHHREGRTSVFVTSDRPSIISRFNDRLVYSSVNLEDVVAVAPFSSSSFPSALAIATPSGIRIGRVDDIRRVDVQAVALEDEEPRRIAYDPQTDTFGVICLRRDVDRQTGEQTSLGSIKVFENRTFKVLAGITLQPNEEGQSITNVKSGDSTYYVIGTTFVDPSESEPTKGRLLVIGEDDSNRSWTQLSSIQIGGCPYALAAVGANTHVAAAINSQVTVYTVDAFSQTLTAVSSWGGAFIAFNLAATGPNKTDLLVGDALRSVTVLAFSSDPVTSLKEISSDYDAHYTSAVQQIDEDEYIGAETDLNLFTVLKEKSSTTRSALHDDAALSPRAAFHLGELVTKFLPGSLAQQHGDNGSVASPRLIYTTSAGSIGVIAHLNTDAAKLLSDLERNMCSVLKGTGGLNQEEFRAFRSERRRTPAAGFVDGDFVGRFVELSEESMQRVLAGTNEYEKLSHSIVDVLKTVEEAARLH